MSYIQREGLEGVCSENDDVRTVVRRAAALPMVPLDVDTIGDSSQGEKATHLKNYVRAKDHGRKEMSFF